MWVVNGFLQTATDPIQREKWITLKRGQRSHTSLMVKGESHQAGKSSDMENLKSEFFFFFFCQQDREKGDRGRMAANNCEERGKWVENKVISDMMHSLVWTTCRNEFSEEQASTDVGVIVMRSLDARWSALVCEHDTFCMMKPCREKKQKKTLGANENFMAQCLHSSSISSSHPRKIIMFLERKRFGSIFFSPSFS